MPTIDAYNGPSIRMMVKWYSDKVLEHAEVHDDQFQILEVSEKILAETPSEENCKETRARMNRMRKWTRRT
jgi:hypothetical protein